MLQNGLLGDNFAYVGPIGLIVCQHTRYMVEKEIGPFGERPKILSENMEVLVLQNGFFGDNFAYVGPIGRIFCQHTWYMFR